MGNLEMLLVTLLCTGAVNLRQNLIRIIDKNKKNFGWKF